MTNAVAGAPAKIDFVQTSTVELIKSNASDHDVASAAWVSNFDRNNLPASIGSVPDQWFLDNYGDDLEYMARRYPEYTKRIEGLINFLYRERHMSPFEHGSMTFYIDTPIFVAREFMRHRTFSYNETSGRYKELAPRFFLVGSERPLVQTGKVGAYRFEPGTPEQYGNVMANTEYANEKAWVSYQNMLDAGVAREVARNVLPVNTMTQFYATANPRNVMQFLLLRNDPNALEEIRVVAEQIEEQFAKQMPLTYAAFKKYDWRDEKVELAELRAEVKTLRAKVEQDAAFETYRPNLDV